MKTNYSLLYNYDELFLEELIQKMSTNLYSPEETIIKQGEDSKELFFIITGDCCVNIVDENRVEHIAYKLLNAG
jgi:CRP-like cAMP-binding protein